MTRQLKVGLLVAGGLVALVVAWLIRPILHWPLMLVYE